MYFELSYAAKRPAIAMIELVFAIVIMGIAVMSAPSLISTATQSTESVFAQESIDQGVTRIAMILTYPWDENDANSSFPLVLRVSNGDPALEPSASDPFRRKGVPKNPGPSGAIVEAGKHRVFATQQGEELNASAIGLDAGEGPGSEDDIDDFTDTTLQTVQSTGGDYVLSGVTIATSVSYASDSANYGNRSFTYVPVAGSPTTNIKKIDVNVSSTHGLPITLHAFSCNIGGIEYAQKVFQ